MLRPAGCGSASAAPSTAAVQWSRFVDHATPSGLLAGSSGMIALRCGRFLWQVAQHCPLNITALRSSRLTHSQDPMLSSLAVFLHSHVAVRSVCSNSLSPAPAQVLLHPTNTACGKPRLASAVAADYGPWLACCRAALLLRAACRIAMCCLGLFLVICMAVCMALLFPSS